MLGTYGLVFPECDVGGRQYHYWRYSDSGLEIHCVTGKTEQLGWGRIKLIDVEAVKTSAGESYRFTLHTEAGKYDSGRLLMKGSRDFLLQIERMAQRYGFEVKRW